MQRAFLLILLALLARFSDGQIIADHTAVADFDSIPAEYITKVKKMLVAFPGESHSAAMRAGMELLEEMDATYACNVSEGEAYTDQYLRVLNYGWIGELEWFTWFAYDEADRPYPVRREFKHLMELNYNEGHPITALGFAWCYDMVLGEGNETEGVDPTYGVHWYGASDGGPDGNKAWGLDADDYAITGNRVSLQTYFDTMEDYIAHVKALGLGTKMVFTTGPVDYEGQWFDEGAFQGQIKHEAIRDYVKADTSRILFDYADILCYDDNGTLTTQTWNGHTFPSITPTNELPRSNGHISDAGAIRLAKAQWWMLARIAGWAGSSKADTTPPTVPEGLTATSIAETSVTLSWSASTDDLGVSGYHIYRSGALIGTTASLTFTDATMAACGEFIYTVSAFDTGDHESAQSSSLQVNTCLPEDFPPTVPEGLTATSIAETSVTLSWSASTDDLGVSGYYIYRSGALIGSTASLTFTDATMAACGEFMYTVSAFDTGDQESAQSSSLQVNTCLPEDPSTSSDHSLSSKLSIYPNPSNGQFLMELGSETGSFTLEIISPSGTKIAQKQVQLNESPLQVNLDDLPSGLYYIRIYNGERSYSAKQVIANR